MKVIKCVILVSAAIILTGTYSCSGDKYADVKKALANGNKALEAFREGMAKAENADQVANVLVDFNKAMEIIMPEMRRLEEKYPELLRSQEISPELGEVAQKSVELWKQFPDVLEKAGQHADDEKVQKAMDELKNILK